MTITTFGIGYLFGRRTDVTNPTPSYMGIAETFDLTMKQEIKKLEGQFKWAVDAAAGAQSLTGKVKFARWQASVMNDLLIGGTLTAASGRQVSVVVNGLPEQHAGGATVTVTNAGTFAEDLGVFYAANGKQLTRVAATSEATGKYSVNDSTGVYTFGGTDVSGTPQLQFFYEYTVTTQNTVSVVNTLMGASPAYEIHYQHYYVNAQGVPNTFHAKINACRGTDLSIPFKNNDFAKLDFSFEAFADLSGSVATFDYSE